MIIERFTTFYSDVTRDALTQLPRIYSDSVRLVDPVGEHHGLAALTAYFENLLSNTTTCRFDIHSCIESAEAASVTWTMTWQHPSLAKGQPLRLDGMSELRIKDDLIVCQRDYYDLGAMLYEHVPLLGSVIRQLKQRLKGTT